MVRDDIKEQHSKLKDAPFSEKLSYYAYYYWKHVVVALLLIIACVSIVHDVYENSKEKSLYVVFADTLNTSSEQPNVVSDFIASMEIDTNKNPYLFDNGMLIDVEESTSDQVTFANMQRLRLLFTTGEIDILSGTQGTIDDIAASAGLANLEDILPSDLLELYKDQFYYYDYGTDGKIPVGIYMDQTPAIADYYAQGTRPILGISATAPQLNNVLAFLTYIQTY